MQRKRVLFVCEQGGSSTWHAGSFREYAAKHGLAVQAESMALGQLHGDSSWGFDQQKLDSAHHIVTYEQYANSVRSLMTSRTTELHTLEDLKAEGDWKQALKKAVEKQ